MKIIDLLNKIAKDEEIPKEIFYKKQWWKYNSNNDYEGTDWGGCLLNNVLINELNDEVEVIEDNNKIEKISWKEKESLAGFIRNDNDKLDILARRTEKLKKSLNEIIEVLNDKN